MRDSKTCTYTNNMLNGICVIIINFLSGHPLSHPSNFKVNYCRTFVQYLIKPNMNLFSKRIMDHYNTVYPVKPTCG